MTCVGGLRTPWRSLEKVDNAAATGSRISGVIRNFIAEHPDLLKAADGDPNFCGNDPVLVEELRGRLAVELNATSIAPGVSGLWRPGLVRAYVEQAGDPETALPV